MSDSDADDPIPSGDVEDDEQDEVDDVQGDEDNEEVASQRQKNFVVVVDKVVHNVEPIRVEWSGSMDLIAVISINHTTGQPVVSIHRMSWAPLLQLSSLPHPPSALAWSPDGLHPNHLMYRCDVWLVCSVL